MTLLDAAGNVVDTLTTGPDGTCRFVDLSSGEYTVSRPDTRRSRPCSRWPAAAAPTATSSSGTRPETGSPARGRAPVCSRATNSPLPHMVTGHHRTVVTAPAI
ncbi:hypothetical protein SVIOM342S_02985 [Streptomyces violaceorubidus]